MGGGVWTGLSLCLLLLAVAMLGGINWDTYDDPVMALILLRYGAENTPFSNQLYLCLIEMLYRAFPKYNWWLIISIVEIVIGLNVYIFMILRFCKQETGKRILMILLVAATYYFALRQINFTRTACYIANAGLLLFVLSNSEPKRIWKISKRGIGMALFLVGACIRMESAFLVIPFVCLGFLCCRPRVSGKRIKHLIGLGLILAALVGTLELANRTYMSDDMRAWNDALSYKRRLSDYPVELKPDADMDALYAAGIVPSDIEFAKGFSFTYKNVYKDENLQLICENVKTSLDIIFLYHEICLALKYSSMIWLFIIGSVLMKREQNIFMWYMALIILLEAFFMLLGRCPSRVFESILFTGTINGLIYSFLEERKQICTGQVFDRLIIGSVILLTVLMAARGNIRNLLDRDLYKYVHGMTQRELDVIDQDTEHIYVMPPDAFVALAIPDNIFLNYEINYCDNMVYQKGFFSDLPAFKQLLQKYEVQDTIELMYSSVDVYSAQSEEYELFLKTHGCILNSTNIGMTDNVRLVQYSAGY